MGKVKIFTDSTNDLTPEIISKYDVSVLPLYVNFDDGTYRDGIDMTPEMLYKKVEETGKLPKTASASPADFYNAFKPYIDAGQDIIYIGISSALSSTIQNARIAATEFPEGRIEIVDSMNLSTGIGLLVLKAADYAAEGLGVKEVAERVREKVPKVRTAFVIDTLDYLYKGGRCSALQNFMSGIFKIKPIVKVVDGRMILGQKARGKREHALNTMLNNVLAAKDNIDPDRIIITHAMGENDAEYLKKEIAKNINAREIIITKAGCVIFSHCGPNTVGIIYIEK
ncbi:DegV family protein [Fonticella tunisiensis]|uniref:DegV family protein with EDD domain n=1 Tax=Fonticella tunisiensis TaxID=1096341 RepID=A0A4R7KQS9_9CLOT|nr:DegV family protein [Fonticella tunisiensis]TDT61591.1 DegV family protein with EDD domain [Fonticella tunisiensis]